MAARQASIRSRKLRLRRCYAADKAASLATVFMFRAVPFFAAGIRSFVVAIPLP